MSYYDTKGMPEHVWDYMTEAAQKTAVYVRGHFERSHGRDGPDLDGSR